MLDDVLPCLACPHCGGPLRPAGASVICSEGHTMNIARQGYVSLLGRDSGTHTADSADMVAARQRLLDGGAFDPLLDAVAEAARELDGYLAGIQGPVLDLGAGTGRYLATVLDALPGRSGIALDNSKFAARRAARAHPRIGAVVADIWDRIPVRDGSVALLLNVFAPRNGEEMSRVLADGGGWMVVTPQPDHLHELVEPFGMISVDPDKEERLERSLGGLPEERHSETTVWPMSLNREEVADLVNMGPNAGRPGPEAMAAVIAGLPDRTVVTGSVRIRSGWSPDRS